MKLNGISFKNHPFFGDLKIDFSNPNTGLTLDTIVVGGINGSGKTTLLQGIIDVLTGRENSIKESFINIDFGGLVERKLLTWESTPVVVNADAIFSDDVEPTPRLEADEKSKYFELGFNAAGKGKSGFFKSTFKAIEERFRPKIVYLPTEINFKQIKIDTTPYVYKYKFLNIVDEKVTKDIPNFFATFIDRYVYSENRLPDESIQLACDDINGIFKELEIESVMIGLKKDGSRMPIFRNKAGKEFDITGLSSGERQLFFRIISLKMMDINNSVILVDEPEISLHPSWQQKIINVYRNIGENNQVIAATHSPHVLSSVPEECVRVLVNTPNPEVLDTRDMRNSFGVPVKRVLKDIMGLKSDRAPSVQSKIDELGRYIKDKNYKPDEFEKRFRELENILGTSDEDLIRIRIGKLREEKREGNAKNR